MNIEQIEELKTEGKRRTAVSLAACSLACRKRGCRERQRQRKVFTGYLEGRRRAYRGQPVVLPDDTLGFIYGILRGKAAVWKDSPFMIGEREHMVVDVSDIRRYRLPSAVLLGAQKLGTKECRSPRKQETCRQNGCRPCHPGRARGRPKKAASAKTNGDAMSTCEPGNNRPPPTGDYAAWVAYYSQNRAGEAR